MPALLLAVHCKKSDPVSLKDAALEYVESTYGEKAAQDSADDLEAVEELRARVLADAGGGGSPAARAALCRYHRLLCAMESRFPVSRARGHVAVTFPWYDAFRASKRADQANIHFEKAAVVFNLGAALSQAALACDRAAGGGVDAARLFQEAAGAFGELRDSACLKVEPPRPVDLSPECAAMLERLMLAQAQECVADKAAADGKAPATLARLFKQVALYYDECSRLLAAPPLGDHFDRSWRAHAGVKSALAHLQADLHNAAALRAGDELKGVAQEIARLRAAQTSLVAAKKEAKHASRDLQDTVAATEAAVFDRLQRAERENATVYLQRVPSAADLPPIAPAPLVKPLPPRGLAPDEEAARMFAAVVPDTSAKALSKYSALVDALARRQLDALEAASDEARLRLREWELPESLAALDPGGGGAALPHGARLELDKVAAAGGAAHLRGLAAQIRELRVVTAAEVDAAEAELDAEAREDGELAAHYGPRWRRPPSAQLTTTLRSRVAGYRANLEAAAASDARLEAELAAGAAAFAALDPDAAAAAMPRLQSPMLSVDDMEPAAAAATLRGALEGLGTLSSQRAALEEALKARKGADNILPRLLAAPAADVDALFASELRKYDDLVAAVADNTAKQAQLLQAAAVAQAQFRRGYGFEEWRRACERAAAGLRTTAAAFLQLGGSLAEGLRFYASLQDAVGALRRLVGDHVAARRVQRDEMVDALRAAAAAQEAAAAQQLAGMSLAGQQGGYGGQPPPHPPPPPPPPQPQQQQYYAPQQQAGYHQPPPPPPSHAQWPPPAYAQPPPPQQQQQQQYQPQYQQQPQQQQQQAGGYGGGYAPTGPPPPQAPPPPPPPQQGGSLAGFLGFGR